MILMVGATGSLGGMITRRLSEAGKDVRILVRRNSPSEELVRQGMATSAGSLIEAGAHPSVQMLPDGWIEARAECAADDVLGEPDPLKLAWYERVDCRVTLLALANVEQLAHVAPAARTTTAAHTAINLPVAFIVILPFWFVAPIC